jgi:DNA-binding transcriptional regulator YhcF (GntR family)
MDICIRLALSLQVADETFNLRAFSKDLETFAHEAEVTLRGASRAVARGRPENTLHRELVLSLAQLFEAQTGKRATAYKTGSLKTPFSKFVAAAIDALEGISWNPRHTSFDRIVYEELRKWRKPGARTKIL